MLGKLIQKLTLIKPFFKNRKKFIFERLSQDSFSKNLLGFTFRNSKWFSYLKININKLPLQNIKKALSVIFLFIFIFLLAITLVENTMYSLLINYLIQIKSLLAVLLTTLRILPVSVFDIIISSKDRVVNYWLLYSQKYSSKTFALHVRESIKSLKSYYDDLVSSNKTSAVVNTDNLDDQISRSVEVLLLLKRFYQLKASLGKLDHSESVRSLKILTKRESLGSFLVHAANADLKVVEMMLNVKRLELHMYNDMKYKWELRNVTDVMLDPRYLPIQMCKEAGLDKAIINILTSSEYEEINPTSDTPESNTVNTTIEDSTNMTKTQRVLSKNTILHNKSIKTMNLVTSTKKLVTDFANSFDATRNNIWIANNLTTNSNMTNFVQNIKNIYGDYNTLGKKQYEQEILRNHSHNNLSSNIDFIKHYEESFFLDS